MACSRRTHQTQSGGCNWGVLNMSRYKGRHRAKIVEQDYPHHVDMVVPPGGLGSWLDKMYDWHRLYGIKPHRGHGSHDANGAAFGLAFRTGALMD